MIAHRKHDIDLRYFSIKKYTIFTIMYRYRKNIEFLYIRLLVQPSNFECRMFRGIFEWKRIDPNCWEIFFIVDKNNGGMRPSLTNSTLIFSRISCLMSPLCRENLSTSVSILNCSHPRFDYYLPNFHIISGRV